MPKTNDATGATYQGVQGVVQAATGRLDEVDPSLNLDGTVKDGYESDERPDLGQDGEEREVLTADDDLSTVKDEPTDQPAPPSDTEKDAAGREQSSPGNSSRTSSGPQSKSANRK